MARKSILKAAPKKKKMTAATIGRISKRADEKYVGTEIVVFDDNTDVEAVIKQNLRHCNYYYNRQDAYGWIGKWVQKNMSATALREFKAAETWRGCISIGTVCRAHMNGAKLSEYRMDWLKTKIENEILKYGRQSIKSNRNDAVATRVSPATLVKRKTEEYIANLESIVDSWDKLDAPFSLYSDLKSNEIPAITAKAIFDYYSRLNEELKQAIVRKPDEQLKEAYSHFKPAELKRYAVFIETLVNDAETYLTGKKSQRKPRKAKVKSAGQLVSKVKFQKESKELKITSVPAEKIIGAQIAILFNTKYNQISYLVSSSKTGFTIKGTTIQSIDDEQSFKKTVRKASENLNAIVVAPKARTQKLIDELKTTRSKTTGRLNEDVLIVKVY